jgi:hypothetical protein
MTQSFHKNTNMKSTFSSFQTLYNAVPSPHFSLAQASANPPLILKFVCVCAYKEHLHQFYTLKVSICTFICTQSFFHSKPHGTVVQNHWLVEQYQ